MPCASSTSASPLTLFTTRCVATPLSLRAVITALAVGSTTTIRIGAKLDQPKTGWRVPAARSATTAQPGRRKRSITCRKMTVDSGLTWSGSLPSSSNRTPSGAVSAWVSTRWAAPAPFSTFQYLPRFPSTIWASPSGRRAGPRGAPIEKASPATVSTSSASTGQPRRPRRRAIVPAIADLPLPPLPISATRSRRLSGEVTRAW
jgi:hypothetical protein